MMIVQAVWPNLLRWLSFGERYSEFAALLVLNAWLLIILYRQGVRKQLPWFVFYVGWEFLSTAVGLSTWMVSRQSYITLFWWLEVPRVALVVAAVRESFLRTFVGF